MADAPTDVMAEFRRAMQLIRHHSRTIAVNPAEFDQVQAAARLTAGPVNVVASPYVSRGTVYILASPAEVLAHETGARS